QSIKMTIRAAGESCRPNRHFQVKVDCVEWRSKTDAPDLRGRVEHELQGRLLPPEALSDDPGCGGKNRAQSEWLVCLFCFGRKHILLSILWKKNDSACYSAFSA
ncbi:hypothetical protein, partial [Faecalibaculum rodentium]